MYSVFCLHIWGWQESLNGEWKIISDIIQEMIDNVADILPNLSIFSSTLFADLDFFLQIFTIFEGIFHE
jgi:hypothetical protein